MKDKDKKRLDELRAKLLIQGVTLKQEELLSKLLDLGENFMLNIDKLPMTKLNNKEIDEILSRKYDLGPSSEETIDSELYGDL